MNINMIQKIHNNDADVIYFLKRHKKCNQLDLKIYQILSYLFQNNSYSKFYNKIDFIILIISYWQRILESNTNTDDDPIFKTFFEGYEFYTKDLDEDSKTELLYKLPWHLTTIQMSNTKDRINHNYINNVASFQDMTNINFGKDNWISLSIIDEMAIYTIYDDISLNNIDKLNYQIKKNLPMLFKAVNDLEKVVNREKIVVDEKDKHSYNIIIFMTQYFFKNKNEINVNLYEFLYLSIYKLCYWHLEATEVNHKYTFKKPLITKVKEYFLNIKPHLN